jgi:hypothetical protein
MLLCVAPMLPPLLSMGRLLPFHAMYDAGTDGSSHSNLVPVDDSPALSFPSSFYS